MLLWSFKLYPLATQGVVPDSSSVARGFVGNAEAQAPATPLTECRSALYPDRQVISMHSRA